MLRLCAGGLTHIAPFSPHHVQIRRMAQRGGEKARAVCLQTIALYCPPGLVPGATIYFLWNYFCTQVHSAALERRDSPVSTEAGEPQAPQQVLRARAVSPPGVLPSSTDEPREKQRESGRGKIRGRVKSRPLSCLPCNLEQDTEMS